MNEKQLETLEAFIVRRMQKFLTLDEMETRLLVTGDKNLLWICCYTKHEIAVGDEIGLCQPIERKLVRISIQEINALYLRRRSK